MAEDFIPWAKPCFWGNEASYVQEALASTWISGGPFVDRFEEALATLHQVPWVLTCANGTAALHLAFLALNLGPQDEVIVPGFGFLAAANIALLMGACPVFVEVDPRTWCLDPAAVEAAMGPKTKAIVAVHTYGNMVAMDQLLQVAGQIPVVEDAAEALMSRYRGRLAGTMGTLGTFSFQATKLIATGEGGAVVVKDEALASTISLYRSHGMRRKVYYWHDLPGHNFRFTNLQAALGLAQLEHIEEIVRHKRRVWECYRALLEGVRGLELQRFDPEVDPVVWAVAVKLDPDAFPQGRDAVMAQMREAGIETRPGFYAPSQMPHLYRCPSLPVSEACASRILSLPSFPSLSEDQIERICTQLLRLRR